MKQNIILIDSNETEGLDFKKGVEEATEKKWQLIVKNSNNRSSKLSNLIRYCKYAVVPFFVFLKREKYDAIITWQQFYGLFFAFYCRVFHVKKQNTFIKKRRGLLVGYIRSFLIMLYTVHILTDILVLRM